jgi:AcrR family transcriptional regulator
LTRRRIIEAAVRTFEEKSYSNTTMDDIARAAAMSRGTLYLHFDNKAHILRGAVSELPPELPLLTAILDAPDRPQRRVAFAALFGYWGEHVASLWVHVREAATHDEVIDTWLMRFVEDRATLTQRSLERHGVSPHSAKARAFMLLCLWNEYIYRYDKAARQLPAHDAIDALTHIFEATIS